MVKNSDVPGCACGEPSCSGGVGGADCPFLPGHPDGTRATEPLAALVEAAKGLLNNLASNEYYDDHEQEPTAGQVYPDVRRLHATIAYAEQYQKAAVASWFGHCEKQVADLQEVLVHLEQARRGQLHETASEQVVRCDRTIDFAIMSIGDVPPSKDRRLLRCCERWARLAR